MSELVFSSDGRRLATAADREVKIWDVANGQEVAAIQVEGSFAVKHLAFRPDGRQLAVATHNEVAFWDAASGQKWAGAGDVADIRDFRGDIIGLAYGPEGKRMLVGLKNAPTEIREARSGKLVTLCGGHRFGVQKICLTAAGRAVTVSSNGTIKQWDVRSGQTISTIPRQSRTTTGSVALSSDGSLAAALDQGEQVIRVTDTKNRSETEIAATDSPDAIAFRPGRPQIAVADPFGTIKVWDVTSGQTVLEINFPASSLAFDSAGRSLAACGRSRNTIQIWDLAGDAEPTDPVTIDARVGKGVSGARMAWSFDGKWLAVGKQSTEVWDVGTGRLVYSLPPLAPGFLGAVTSLAFSPDGRWLASSDSRTVNVWHATDGQRAFTLRGHAGIGCLAFSPDCQTIASGGGGVGRVRVWSTQGDQKVRTLTQLRISDAPFREVAIDPQGDWIAFCDWSKKSTELKLWDLPDGEPRWQLEIQGEVTDLAAAFDGHRLAAATKQGATTVFDVAKGEQLFQLVVQADEVANVAFSPDGKLLATATEGGRVTIWDARDGQKLGGFEAGRLFGNEGVKLLAFRHDSKQLVVSTDKGLTFWDVAGEEVRVVPLRHRPRTIAWSCDGSLLAIGRRSNVHTILDAKSGTEYATLRDPNVDTHSLIAFSKDGKSQCRKSTAARQQGPLLW